jgi:5-methylcytosine-specific restriction endonuclease McrA
MHKQLVVVVLLSRYKRMKNKYGLEKLCLFCNSKFITKLRFLEYCSQSCKNPINRAGHTPWNKGLTLTEDQKLKQNTEGLRKGWGWNKGRPNEKQKERWLSDNPNKDGRLNKLRPKNPTTDPLKLYRRKVRYFTYRTLKEMEANGEWVPKTGKYKDSWQVDHIIPHKQGFEFNINPALLGSKKNIQFIKGEENRKKWDSYQPIDIVESITGVNYV